ncbi:hypothetical protein QFC21_005217 [Naganishia friedmannii]|uniref:Uncharacterized protein n=1 Tax=Naganishia friedmannii TaxID=89922 RepID=A0ACC2VBC6_9TREE|nr:hypothetical protein QFC21_005217 [Naganishia friedmannii]
MDNSPTSLFEGYDEEFKQILSSLKGKLQGDVRSLAGEQRKSLLRTIEAELDEAQEIIQQMEVELHPMPASIRAPYSARITSSKTDLAKMKKTLKDLQKETQRTDLLGSAASGRRARGAGDPSLQDEPYTDDAGGYHDDSHRARLLAGTDTLADGSRRLDNAQRIALETEDVGADILRNLHGQRSQLEHTRDTLGVADGNIDRASGTLKKMIWQ